METTQQILILGGGLMVAFGFMFMGAFSLSGLTNTQAPNSEGGQQVNATLPEDNFAENGFDLGINEQLTLAVNNQVVFVNAIYEDDPSVFEDLEGVQEEFDGRMYYTSVNLSQTQLDSQLQISDYPEIVVIGDQPRGETAYTLTRAENNRESVISTACSALRDVGNLAATCY